MFRHYAFVLASLRLLVWILVGIVTVGAGRAEASDDPCYANVESCLVYGSPTGGGEPTRWNINPDSGTSLGDVRRVCMKADLIFLPTNKIRYADPKSGYQPADCETDANGKAIPFGWTIAKGRLGAKQIIITHGEAICAYNPRFDLDRFGNLTLTSECDQTVTGGLQFIYFLHTAGTETTNP